MKENRFYIAARAVMGAIIRLLYRVSVFGAENVPEQGAFVLSGNHIHALDPAALAVCVKRQLHFMAKKELFNNFFGRWFFPKLNAFPVDRGAADMRAYRRAIAILEAGGALNIFSQGHRMKTFENAKSGAAMFALKTGAPILPVGIKGSYRPFSKLEIRFGELITMERYAGRKVKTVLVSAVMARVTDAVKALSR